LTRGNIARNPSRIKDSDLKPLAAKSGSEDETISSKSFDLLVQLTADATDKKKVKIRGEGLLGGS